MFTVDEARCDGCGGCLDVCAQGAVRLVNGKASIDPGRCNACGACMHVCPAEAIRQQVPQGRVTTSRALSFTTPPSSGTRMPALPGGRAGRRCRRRRGWMR